MSTEVADVLRLASLATLEPHRHLQELGLDSLMAIELRNALGRRLGIALPTTVALDHPTLDALAGYLRDRIGRSGSGDEDEDPAWDRVARRGPARGDGDEVRLAPLSFGQERLWFLDRLAPESGQYNELSALRSTGPLDIELLRRCLALLVKRHESLRTAFPELAVLPGTAEIPRALIAPDGPTPLDVIDLRAHDGDGPRSGASVTHMAAELRARPFDLVRGPLWRARVLIHDEHRHTLLFVKHHIITDATSESVFADELARLYRSGADAAVLPELRFQYSDFVRYSRARAAEDRYRESAAWWKERLAGLPRLELPYTAQKAKAPSPRGDVVRVNIAPALARSVREFTLREGHTLFAVLLAGWACVLHRYCGQSDFAIGTVIANRNRTELDRVLGFFINTVVLRCDLSSHPTFVELVARMAETTRQALRHQDVDFGEVVRAHHGEAGQSLDPIVQTTLNLLPPFRALPGGEGASLAWDDESAATVQAAKFDIYLELVEHEDGLRGKLEYAADSFDRTTIEAMAAHFEVLLGAAMATPDVPIGRLSMLSQAERSALLRWNDTARDYRNDKLVHQLAMDQAARTPEAVAVVFEGRELRYAELRERANQLAHALQTRGVGRNTVVGVCMHRSLELVVALLGILQSGAAFMPLDPDYPDERLAFMISDSKSPVVITQPHLDARIEVHGVPTLQLEPTWAAIADQPRGEPNRDGQTGSDLVYVIFTSGSTGKPKGVMNEHRGLLNRLQWIQETYGLTTEDSVLQKTPFSFDVSVWEFFWPLVAGARLVVARPDGHRDPAYIAQLIVEQNVTTVHFVPSMLRAFLEEPRVADCRTLRRVIASGEALPFDLVQQFWRRSSAELLNLYGPTEASIEVSFWHCRPNDVRGIVPIGRPIANTQLHVLNENLEPLPIGTAGELYIGGVGVARGYLGREELTAERFVCDPFGTEGARLYRTGDRCRWLPDGTLEYLGRIDHQVKLRGQRVELGEIEAAIHAHPGVREAVVVAREGEGGDKHLVAYVVPDGESADSSAPREAARWFGQDQLERDVIGALRKQLPEYMVPSSFVMLESLPLTSSGKVDRRALPSPRTDVSRAGRATAARSPRDDLEQAMVEIWREILEREDVGVGETFYELGGTSIQLVRVQNRLSSKLNLQLTVAELFAHPSIDALAKHVREEGRSRSQASTEADWVEKEKKETKETKEKKENGTGLEELPLTELYRTVKERLATAMTEYEYDEDE
ncbi:amino acid adenylation domain-containing protein [Pendulispora albinea]|uniref:Amino acid adenylation domain-containing protein n=1 Tax=Pendulispora albinea TaxID=2741071 RepID=A0ABZ2MAN2_9BACT